MGERVREGGKWGRSEKGELEYEVRRSGKMRKEEDCGDISRVVSVAVCGVSKREKYEVRDGERRAREVRGDRHKSVCCQIWVTRLLF